MKPRRNVRNREAKPLSNANIQSECVKEPGSDKGRIRRKGKYYPSVETSQIKAIDTHSLFLSLSFFLSRALYELFDTRRAKHAIEIIHTSVYKCHWSPCLYAVDPLSRTLSIERLFTDVIYRKLVSFVQPVKTRRR